MLNPKAQGLEKQNHRNVPGFFVKTFGWPMGAVLYDYSYAFRQHLVNTNTVEWDFINAKGKLCERGLLRLDKNSKDI
jgi:hypothetical protein